MGGIFCTLSYARPQSNSRIGRGRVHGVSHLNKYNPAGKSAYVLKKSRRGCLPSQELAGFRVLERFRVSKRLPSQAGAISKESGLDEVHMLVGVSNPLIVDRLLQCQN